MGKYYPRLVDEQLKAELEAFGAVLITGPKWCGKTTTGMQLANSALFLQDPDESGRYQQILDVKPSLLLEGDPPVD